MDRAVTGEAAGAGAGATMAAWQVRAFGAPPERCQLPMPEPGPGEALVRVSVFVVSHLDRTVAGGAFALRPRLPYVPGGEGSGVVTALGAGLEGPPPGSPVRVHGAGLGATRPGTWAQYVVAPPEALEPLPRDLDPATGAAFGTVASTAWVALHDVGGWREGERVGVSGALGAVGSLCAELAIRAGAGLTLWTRRPDEAVRRWPSAEVLSTDGERSKVALDLLVDTVGGEGLMQRLAALRPGGRAVLVGYTAGETLPLVLPDLMARDVELRPLNMVRHAPPEQVRSGLLADVAAGKLPVALERFGGGRVLEAIAHLESGAARGRVVVEW